MTGYRKFILGLAADLPSLRDFFPGYAHAVGDGDVLVCWNIAGSSDILLPIIGTMLMLSVRRR